MKTKIGLIVLVASLPLMASQTLQLSSNLPDGAISPYSSTINGIASTAPNLYCDDINDTANYGTYNVQIITLAEAGGTGVGKGTGLDAGRFSTAANLSWTKSLEGNVTVTAPPNATDLYEEAAWLFAQMAGNSSTQDTYIQEAAWELMTNATSVPNWSQYGDPENQASADWLKLAASYYGADTETGSVSLGTGYSSTKVNLSTTTYTDWFVADAAPTCTGAGANETCGALPTTDSDGQTWQEFLIYSNNGVIINPTGATPEPATFGLLGGALLFGGLFARRKSLKK